MSNFRCQFLPCFRVLKTPGRKWASYGRRKQNALPLTHVCFNAKDFQRKNTESVGRPRLDVYFQYPELSSNKFLDTNKKSNAKMFNERSNIKNLFQIAETLFRFGGSLAIGALFGFIGYRGGGPIFGVIGGAMGFGFTWRYGIEVVWSLIMWF